MEGKKTSKANTNITELGGYRYLNDSITYTVYLNITLVLHCLFVVVVVVFSKTASEHKPDSNGDIL